MDWSSWVYRSNVHCCKIHIPIVQIMKTIMFMYIGEGLCMRNNNNKIHSQLLAGSFTEWASPLCRLAQSEAASTHQCTNVDGWCTDRILFSLPLPSQLHFFFLCPFSALTSVFFFGTFFHPAPTQFLSSSSFLLKLSLTHLLPPIVPHWPTHLYV
jgi:hypothetical protein